MATDTDVLQSGHVVARVNGTVGLLELARPEAFNALSLPMVRDLTRVLRHWATRPEVQAVVLLGRPRADGTPVFCAGGDIRFMHAAARTDEASLQAFFNEEYALDHLIHHYAKPVLALMDGVVMGGGMGLAQGAKLRVVSERSRLSMPETRIGLAPDVGASWFFGQMPGRVGEWLAVTGQDLEAGDAVELGLADVFVPAAEWDGMLQDLSSGTQPHAEHAVATVMQRAALAPAPQHLGQRAAIDRHFAGVTLADIVASLAQEPEGPWVRVTREHLRVNSPLAMAVSLALVRRSRGLSVADALRLERVVMWHGFAAAARGGHCEALEGIRALSLDKDRQPRWQPASVAAVTPEAVDAFFTSPWTVETHPLAGLA